MFDFLFKYPRAVFEQGEVLFAGPLAEPWVVLAAAVVAAGVVAWSYVAAARVGVGRRVALACLRAAALLVLLAALFRPVLRVPVAVSHENYVAVLVDDSRSMSVRDMDGRSRGDVAAAAVAGDSEWLEALRSRFRVRLFRFGGSMSQLGSADELTFSDGRTGLGQAFDAARAELAGLPIAGMVLLSDGADRRESELNPAILGLRASGVPIYAVGVGRERFERDVRVERVATPASVLRGSSLAVDVVVRQTGYAGRPVSLVVEDEGRVIEVREFQLPMDGAPAVVRVNLTAEEPGSRAFRFRVPPQERELVRENNERVARLDVRTGPEKILYLEGEPRFEVKFTRRAIADDPELQLVLLQRTAENRFLRLEVDSAGELAGGFPRTREELFAYRGLVLGSMEAGFFTPEQLRLIADFVAERGGGLLALGGRRSFAEGDYAGTALASALPVELPAAPAAESFLQELAVRPTRAGLTNASLQLSPDPAESREQWETLPPLSSFNRIPGVKPGATALLTASGPGYEHVVLGYHRYGRGTAFALPVQDTWTWQMDAGIPLEDDRHERFWGQLLRWLVNDVPDRVTLSAGADRVALGDPIRLRAEVRDAGFLPVNDALPRLLVTDAAGAVDELAMKWTGRREGEYEVLYTPPAEGLYTAALELAGADPQMQGRRPVSFEAVLDDGELQDPEMRAEELARLARETGGRFYTAGNLERVPEELSYSGRGITSVEQRDLWDMPIVFLLLVAFLATEWALRRRWGLA